MKAGAVPLMLLALAGCVTTRFEARELQTPRPAPQALLMFPYAHELRDAVVLEYITGVSQYSYLFAEPNQNVLRPLIVQALENTGLRASTPVRARYGLRVLVQDAEGPGAGGDMRAFLRATYVIVERASGRELFRQVVETGAEANFLKLNEGDLRRATQRSLTVLRAVNHAGASLAGAELLYDFDPTVIGQGNLWDGQGGSWWDPIDYEEWTQADWYEFWEAYRFASVAALAVGPVLTGLEMANPLNFFPFASDSAAAHARGGEQGAREPQARSERDGRTRAARAIQRASAANVTRFLVALTEREGVEPIPILPCWGSPAVEALKHALVAQGRTFRTDDCRIAR